MYSGLEARSIGKFRLIAALGRGGMSDVFLTVTDEKAVDFAKLVVVKTIRKEFADDEDFVAMFLDEARISSRLNHPNVIQTMEVGRSRDDYFLAMEYLEGESLGRVLSRSSFGMPLNMHLAVLIEALNGIHYAHELRDYDGSALNVVHRDLTPHNIFVTYDGRVKVMDFGIAKAAGRRAETRHGVVKGKLSYMSPEQVMATRAVDRRADIFSAGVMLFEAAIRGRMWEGVPEATRLRLLVAGEHPISPKEVDPSVSSDLDRICRRALATQPEQRYQTAHELLLDLENALGKMGGAPSARHIGDFVDSYFAEQRATARDVVEAQLSAMIRSTRALALANLGHTGSRTSEINLDETMERDTRSVPEPEEKTPTLPTGRPLDSQGGRTSGNLASPQPRKSRRLLVLGVVGALALLVAAAGALTLINAQKPRPEAVAVLEERTLTLRATPLETHFRIDDGPPLDNPYITKIVNDGHIHHVRADARGFAPKVKELSFDQDRALTFVLSKESTSP